MFSSINLQGAAAAGSMTDALIVNPPVAVAPPLYLFLYLFFSAFFLLFHLFFPQVPSVTHYAEVQLRPTQTLLFAAHGAGFNWLVYFWLPEN